jgi:hypothetical protein
LGERFPAVHNQDILHIDFHNLRHFFFYGGAAGKFDERKFYGIFARFFYIFSMGPLFCVSTCRCTGSHLVVALITGFYD